MKKIVNGLLVSLWRVSAAFTIGWLVFYLVQMGHIPSSMDPLFKPWVAPALIIFIVGLVAHALSPKGTDSQMFEHAGVSVILLSLMSLIFLGVYYHRCMNVISPGIFLLGLFFVWVSLQRKREEMRNQYIQK